MTNDYILIQSKNIKVPLLAKKDSGDSHLRELSGKY